jgi:aspartate ammonia-lyase
MLSSSFSYRIEHDSLGEVRVPSDALFGGQTQRAVENFPISGLRPRRAFIWSMAVIKESAAQVNCELGLLEPNFTNAIVAACQEIMAGQWDNQFVVDPFQAGAGTSHHMNVNEVIANRATQMLGGALGQYLVHPNDHVNLAQSTNDVIPTAIRLGCLWRMGELLQAADDLSTALYDKSVEFQDVLKSGRTHLQDAVPIRLGQEFSGYASAVDHDRHRIQRTAENLYRIGIGGTAAGTGLNAHPEYHKRMVKRLSERTGLALLSSGNLFESMQSMADLVDFSAAMRTLAVTLIRIANDLRLLASGPATGLDEIRMPAVQPGSSIMPGKINPVMAEMLNMAMFQIIGCDSVVALAAQAGQLELNVMMPVIACNLFDMQQIMIASIQAITRKCITGIQANPSKAAGWLEQNTIVVTALNPLIGYAAGAALVKEAQERNRTIHDLAVEKAQMGLLLHRQNSEKVTVKEIETALSDLGRLTEGGIFSG